MMSETKSDLLVFNQKRLEEKQYWLEQLTARIEASGLRTDFPRPSSFVGETDSLALNLNREIHRQLIAFTKDGPFLLYTTLLAALKVWLYQYTEKNLIVVGSPARLPEGGVDHPANALAIVDHVEDSLSFRELLMNVRQTLLDAYAKQFYPYHRLVKDLGLDSVRNKCPLFDVALVLKNIHSDLPQVKNDISLIFNKEPERITGIVTFNKSLFELKSIEIFAKRFKAVLSQALENIDIPVGDIALCTEAEKRRLLYEWNQTGRQYPRSKSITDLFQQWVTRTPEATALSWHDLNLTYGELNARANRLAHFIRSFSVGPEVRVGICLNRSFDLIIALLAILKAGAVYVPLDPDYPQARISFLLEDARIALLLTHQSLVERLPSPRPRVICLDSDSDRFADCPSSDPPPLAGAENLAYVIYTSGSTGQPKGVEVTHRAVLRLLLGTDYLRLDSEQTLLCLAPISFDASTFEVWGALLHGARLLLVEKQEALSPLQFASLLSREKVTVMFLTTAWFNQLAATVPTVFSTLEDVLFGGEAVDVKWVREVMEKGRPQRLLHVYGPTETTTFATWHLVQEVTQGASTVPIGKPISNTRAYVLGRRGKVLPVGVTGELYIGGEGLARCYGGSAEWTAERFAPDHVSGEAGQRLYRTGDLVRWRDGGELEYVGRVDEQVKLRGYRIELGEIESVLRRHAGVAEAVVVVREDMPGHKRLVAYIVPGDKLETSVDELKRYLMGILPDYMMPSGYVLLESLPLGLNGKVDRKALPPPNDNWQEMAVNYVAPRNDVEKILADIWSRVLGVERVGINDSFFKLGGDSILSIEVIAKAAEKNIHFTAKQLFLHKTIGELAQAVGDARLVVAEQGTVVGLVPLSPAQHWFFEEEIADVHHWKQEMLLDLRQTPDPASLKRAVEHLQLHHDALRLRVRLTDQGWEQRIIDAAEDEAFIHVNLSHLGVNERERVIGATISKLQAGLNLTEGPLLRVAYLQEAHGRPGKLLFIVHHFAIDGVSWRILLEDFNTAYDQALNNRPIALREKTTSFKYWSGLLTMEAQTERIRGESGFWLNQNQFVDKPLPLDFNQGNNLASSARSVNVSLSIEETRALLQDVPAAYGSEIKVILLTALLEALGRWTGERAFRVTFEGHGREEIFDQVDLSRTVGWFTSLYPVCLDLSETRSNEEAIEAVTEQLKVIPNHGIGYGMLKYLAQDAEVRERLRRIPPPQVSFNYFGQLDQIFAQESLFDLGDVSKPDAVTGINPPEQSTHGKRPHLLDVTGHVVGRRLELGVIYSENLHKRLTIERLARDFGDQLRRIISRGQEMSAKGYAPAVFTHANLSEEEIRILLTEIG